ncbi:unnamed protein product [Amoebophrya sp. A120]|nr:unnamed protein product [Amoebophrya sp. A120]|eukprot:GSA120T00020363001.1
MNTTVDTVVDRSMTMPKLEAWPLWRRLLVILLGVVSSLLCAGLVFGFAGLYPRLLQRGVFYQDCVDPSHSLSSQILIPNGRQPRLGEEVQVEGEQPAAIIQAEDLLRPRAAVERRGFPDIMPPKLDAASKFLSLPQTATEAIIRKATTTQRNRSRSGDSENMLQMIKSDDFNDAQKSTTADLSVSAPRAETAAKAAPSARTIILQTPSADDTTTADSLSRTTRESNYLLENYLLEASTAPRVRSETSPTASAKTCSAQQLDLSFMFTLATTLLNVTAFVSGLLLDSLGPKYAACLAALISGCGNWLFGYGFYYVGFQMMAVAGPLVYMATISFSNLYPHLGGLITSACVGCFDASSFVFVILAACMSYLPFDDVFQTYSLVGLSLAVLFLLFYPRLPIRAEDVRAWELQEQRRVEEEKQKREMKKQKSNGKTQAGDATADEPTRDRRDSRLTEADATTIQVAADQDEEELERDKRYQQLLEDQDNFAKYDGLTLLEQIQTPDFLLFAFSASCYMVRLNFFIESVPLQMQQFSLSSEEADIRTHIFSVMLPAAGLVGIPVNGFLTDQCGTVASWAALWFFFLAFQLCFELGWFLSSFVFICLARPLFYTMIAVFTGRHFGFQTFGKLYGTVCSVAGLANASQYYLNKVLVQSVYDGNYVPVNRLLTTVQVFTIALPVYLFYDAKNRWAADQVGKNDVAFAGTRLKNMMVSMDVDTTEQPPGGIRAFGSTSNINMSNNAAKNLLMKGAKDGAAADMRNTNNYSNDFDANNLNKVHPTASQPPTGYGYGGPAPESAAARTSAGARSSFPPSMQHARSWPRATASRHTQRSDEPQLSMFNSPTESIGALSRVSQASIRFA